MITHLERVRFAELEGLREFFPAGSRVLEVGGGSGYQASIIAAWGCSIVSIDLQDEQNPSLRYFSQQHFPVQPYDGKNFPFPDASFDILFSSNVLCQIASLEPFLKEARRLLKPGGRMIHIVPTASWRFWTCAAHYVFYLAALGRRLGPRQSTPANAGPGRPPSKEAVGSRLRRLLIAPPEGAAPSALVELVRFRKSYWADRFTAVSLNILACMPAGVFHTGYILKPDLPIAARRRWARWLGSSCQVFVLEARR